MQYTRAQFEQELAELREQYDIAVEEVRKATQNISKAHSRKDSIVRKWQQLIACEIIDEDGE